MFAYPKAERYKPVGERQINKTLPEEKNFRSKFQKGKGQCGFKAQDRVSLAIPDGR